MPEPRNPFLVNLRIEFISAKKKSVFFGRNDSGKETTDYFYRERAEKTNIYKTPAFYTTIPELKEKPLKLLLYITMNLGWGKDRIRLDREKVCLWGKFSVASYYTAIGDLVNAGVICKHHKDDYWVNPGCLFKGDRFKYASENGVSSFPYKKQQSTL